MISLGVARIPEDRHAEGLIGEMSITENVISESYRSAEFAARGFIRWKKARALRPGNHRGLRGEMPLA